MDEICIKTVRNIQNFLGESPFYEPESRRLYWVDILKNTLNYWHTENGQIGRWELRQPIGCAVPVQNRPNIVLIAGMKGIGLFDIVSSQWIHSYSNPESSKINTRFNDGKCGPDGTFWVGSMNYFNTSEALSDGYKEAALYSLCGKKDNCGIKKKLDYVGLSNGMAWSKSGEYFYYIDTASYRVAEYIYKHTNRSIRLNRPNLIIINPHDGSPDGCAIDTDDNLWIALWGGSTIRCYSTTFGELLHTIDLPDKYITSLAWFGPNLDKLFVTSAISDSLVNILDQMQSPDKSDADSTDVDADSSDLSDADGASDTNKSDEDKTDRVDRKKRIAKQQKFSEKGRVYIIDFSKTMIRGAPVGSFIMDEFRD